MRSSRNLSRRLLNEGTEVQPELPMVVEDRVPKISYDTARRLGDVDAQEAADICAESSVEYRKHRV